VSERGSYAPGASGVVDLRRQGEGRCAVVADPHGATFGVIAGEPPEE
jgi:hypothetical protein